MNQAVKLILTGVHAMTTCTDDEVASLVEALALAWQPGGQTMLTITDASGGMPMYINSAAIQMVQLKAIEDPA